jgi:predicted NBD/HSP70 family sugar kinase
MNVRYGAMSWPGPGHLHDQQLVRFRQHLNDFAGCGVLVAHDSNLVAVGEFALCRKPIPYGQDHDCPAIDMASVR